MPKAEFIPQKLRPWIEARKRYHLSHAQVQMARELGMNPKKLGGMANHKQEPWKMPSPQFIEHRYQTAVRKENAGRRALDRKEGGAETRSEGNEEKFEAWELKLKSPSPSSPLTTSRSVLAPESALSMPASMSSSQSRPKASRMQTTPSCL
jgi:hypothetical protein